MTEAAPSRVLQRARARLRATPETLAVFRIAVGFALLLSGELHGAVRFAELAPAQRIAPQGLGWFAAIVPIGVALASIVRAVAVAAALATILGVYARVATIALAVASFYLLALGQLGGTVVHDMHLVWFATVLAASRCADVWSVDAWWAARESEAPVPSPRAGLYYGVPVWTARWLFACVYFFPGLHKVLVQGLAWASFENLALQLHWKWFEWGHVPTFRLDHHPALLVAGGFGTLAFELGFPLLLLTRRTRVLAAVAGVSFHLATDHFFRIPFSSLWLCYPVLFDWAAKRHAADVSPRVWPKVELVVAVSLLVPIVAQGFRGKMDSFPFACYPTFERRAPTYVPDLRIVVVRADGTEIEVPHARGPGGVRAQSDWGRIWALIGATKPFDRERLVDYGRSVQRASPGAFEHAVRIEMRRAYYAVSPDARGAPPRSEQLLVALAA